MSNIQCPRCNSNNIAHHVVQHKENTELVVFKCEKCNLKFSKVIKRSGIINPYLL